MVKINLPQLRQPELPSVTSTVVDTFYKPQQKPVNPALMDLSRSLSDLVPTLRRYDLLKEEQTKISAEDKADADFAKNKQAFKDIVKQGVIPEGASPYYINQLAKNQLKQDAREFKERLFDKWNEENVWRDENPLTFDNFYKSFSEEFYAEKKLGGYADATLVEGFLPDANAAYNELAQRNREKRIVEIENTQKDLLTKETYSLLDDSLNIEPDALDNALADVPNADNLDEDEKRTLYSSLAIQQLLDNLIDSGMNPRTANEVVVDTVISYAETLNNPEFLDVLNNIVTDKNSGSRLANTDYSFEKINSALVRIDQNTRSNILFYQGQKDKQRVEKNRGVQNDFYEFVIQDPQNLLNISAFIQSQKDKGVEIDSSNYNDIITLKDAYIKNLNSEDIIIDQQVYRNLLVDINTNPNDETLFERLTDALENNQIDTSTFNTLYSALKSSGDPQTSEYFKSSLWGLNLESLKSVVTRGATGLFDTTNGEKLNQAEIRLHEVAYDIIAEIASDEELSKLSKTKRLDYFFERIEKEVNRLKPLLRDELDMTQDNVELSQDLEAIRNPL